MHELHLYRQAQQRVAHRAEKVHRPSRGAAAIRLGVRRRARAQRSH